MTYSSQYSALATHFHGDGDNIVLQIKNISNGTRMYADAFEACKTNTVVMNKDDKDGPSHLKLKTLFSRNSSKTYHCGEEIKLDYLSLKLHNPDSGMISGHNLFDMAKLVIKHVKKATAFAKDFVQKKGNGNDDWELPSGTTIEDLIEHVLAEMFLWENKIMRDGETDSTVGSDVEPEDMPGQKPTIHPPGYYFAGFFAFILFGKFNANPSLHLECFCKR